ncbi:hypothetical protein CR513_34555, partial [Mucuna pruriens]
KLKVSQNLGCINCEYLTKVKLIALSFKGYALVWWNEISLQIRGMRRVFIESWEELKQEIRERFVPSFCKHELFVKLLKMYQGARSVEEYFKEMEVTTIRAQIVEFEEVTMAIFLIKGNIAYQCPNKQTMILKDDCDIDNESSHKDSSTSSSEEYYSDVPFKGELLM